MKLAAPMIAIVLATGCTPSDGPPQPATLGDATLAGYGRANGWAYDMDATCADLEACASNGVDLYTIELGGARDFSGFSEEQWLAIVEVAYPRLMEKAIECGVTVLVSVVNDNAGSGRYRQDGPTLANQHAYIKALTALVAQVGPENVILQPVAETQTVGGRWAERYIVAELVGAGFVFAANGERGHPSTTPEWARWRVWHPFDIYEIPDGDLSDCIVVSDTGRIIRQLGNGTLDGPGNASAIEIWASNMKAAGVVAAVYYAFRYDGASDTEAIKAIGRGVR